MMHVSGHKTQKTFMDYIKLSSDDLKMGEFPRCIRTSMSSQIADEIDAIANGTKSEVF